MTDGPKFQLAGCVITAANGKSIITTNKPTKNMATDCGEVNKIIV